MTCGPGVPSETGHASASGERCDLQDHGWFLTKVKLDKEVLAPVGLGTEEAESQLRPGVSLPVPASRDHFAIMSGITGSRQLQRS